MKTKKAVKRVLSIALAFMLSLGIFSYVEPGEAYGLTYTDTYSASSTYGTVTAVWDYSVTYGRITINSVTVTSAKSVSNVRKLTFEIEGEYSSGSSNSIYGSQNVTVSGLTAGVPQTFSFGSSFRVSVSSTGNFNNTITFRIRAASSSSSSSTGTIIWADDVYVTGGKGLARGTTVTYDANGGTGAPAAQTMDATSVGTTSVISSAVPVREGYTFAGWKATAAFYTGGSYRSLGAQHDRLFPAGYSSWVWDDSYTLTAQWAPDVTYNANLRGPSGTTAAVAKLVSPPNGLIIDQDGYIYYNGSPVKSPDQISAADTPVTYDLYDTDDASFINLQKKGYHLIAGEEWNTQPDGSGTSYSQSEVYAISAFSGPVTLYANWKSDAYVISYLPNGATSGSMASQEVAVGTPANANSNSYVRDGYKFRGWDRDPDADPDGTLDIAGDKGIISDALLADYTPGDTISLYAIWSEMDPSSAEIVAGKTKYVADNGTGGEETETEFTFRIEPVEGWNDQEDRSVAASEMPMPEGTADGAPYKDITATGLLGNGSYAGAASGEISFEEPGWYMYRVSEIAGGSAGVDYDSSEYYVIAYVQYKEETGVKVEVSNITAWRNRHGMSNYRPNLEDISALPDVSKDVDRDGEYTESELSYYSLQENTEDNYAKTGIGGQTVTVNFWNTEYTDGPVPVDPLVNLRIMKNLKGNLGDRTKKFEYTAALTGLAPGATYVVVNDGAELDSGFSSSDSVTAGADGSASLAFRMRDDDSIYIDSLPVNAVVNVTESGSDHVPGCRIYTDDGSVDLTLRALFGSSVSTGDVTMTGSDTGTLTYTIRFDNYRELAPVTGVTERGLPAAGAVIVLLAAAEFICTSIRKRKRFVQEE